MVLSRVQVVPVQRAPVKEGHGRSVVHYRDMNLVTGLRLRGRKQGELSFCPADGEARNTMEDANRSQGLLLQVGGDAADLLRLTCCRLLETTTRLSMGREPTLWFAS